MRWLCSFFVDLLLNFSSVPVKKQKHLHQLIAFATFFVAGAVNFPPPFPVFFFFPPGRDIPGTTSPTSLRHCIYQKHFHYNVYNNCNHVHGPHIFGHFKELLLKGLPKIRKWQWWQKAIYSRPAQVIFDAIFLCILCATVSQKLYCARVSHEMAQFVLKMSDLSISIEPTPLLKKRSATISYNDYGSCSYLTVAFMLAS